MTHIFEINLEHEDLFQTAPALPSVCIGCLSKCGPYIKLINCKHVAFFERFFQDEIDYLETLVCLQCHFLLKKFDLFRQQVKESLNVLNNQPQQMPANTKFQNIQLTPIKMLSVSPINMKTSLVSALHTPSHLMRPLQEHVNLESNNNETNISLSSDHYYPKPITVSVKSETANQAECETTRDIKIELESCSDVEIEVPLIEFKGETSIQKLPKDITIYPVHQRYKVEPTKEISNIPVPEGYNGKQLKDIKLTELKPVHQSYKDQLPLDIEFIPPHERYEGKVKIVTLTKEELMLERDKERLGEKYLKLPYKCETCVTAFDHEILLKNHMMKRHTVKPGTSVCEICKCVFGASPYACKEHIKRHFARYDCVECGKRYNSLLGATTHCGQVHGSIATSYQCQECDFTTQRYRQYRYHKQKHRQRVPCPQCDKKFVSTSGLKTHLLVTHRASDRVYTCESCGKVFRHKSAASNHQRSAHSGLGTAYCAPCNAHFRTEQGLSYHLKYHSKHLDDSAKRFECDYCGKRYPLKCSLLDHINGMHLKRYWYSCNQCDEKFLWKTYLRRHKVTTHKKGGAPRDKICQHCGKGFTTNRILEAHIRTHTGERPLECAHCPATFAHPAARYNHIKLVHKRKRPAAV